VCVGMNRAAAGGRGVNDTRGCNGGCVDIPVRSVWVGQEIGISNNYIKICKNAQKK
jgi:hypothetical protein